MDAMVFHFAARRLTELGVPVVPELLSSAGTFLFKSFISPDTFIGDGTQLGYGGSQVVIGPGVIVGKECFISHEVTIAGNPGHEGAPELGDYVFVGAGAQILGNVKVGDYAVIGANAVVLEDVPAGAVVAGIPAVELRRDPDPEASYREWLARATAH
jgi:serine O-acetyltransferase